MGHRGNVLKSPHLDPHNLSEQCLYSKTRFYFTSRLRNRTSFPPIALMTVSFLSLLTAWGLLNTWNLLVVSDLHSNFCNYIQFFLGATVWSNILLQLMNNSKSLLNTQYNVWRSDQLLYQLAIHLLKLSSTQIST